MAKVVKCDYCKELVNGSVFEVNKGIVSGPDIIDVASFDKWPKDLHPDCLVKWSTERQQRVSNGRDL
jgi:hypothetical protein